MRQIVIALAVVALLVGPAGPASADTIYIVQRGDTLARIAANFGVSLPRLIEANAIRNPNLIYVGQRLVIPSGGPAAPPSAPWTGQYVVQSGDTLWRIARRFETTVTAIMTANHLATTRIYPGQVLIIPGAPAPTVPAPVVTPPPSPLPTATPLACAIDWFFGSRPWACPAAPAIQTNAAAERFERGLMVWLEATDTFYVFHNSTDQTVPRLSVVRGPIQIVPGGSVDNRAGGAPYGLSEPVSGFGLLWRGEVEGVEALRTELGWAVEPEYGFHTQYQCEAYPNTQTASTTCYLRAPDGRILLTYYMRYFGYFWKVWL